MATPFNEKEKAAIHDELLQAGWRHLCSDGFRKTTVDDLAAEAGISKGAFYRFYESKELLFLEVAENWYRGICEKAEKVLKENAGLPPAERSRLALREAIGAMLFRPAARFLTEEMPLLLRRLPDGIVEKHSREARQMIGELIERSGVVLVVPIDTTIAAVMILFMSLSNADSIGPAYDSALNALVDSACCYMIAV